MVSSAASRVTASVQASVQEGELTGKRSNPPFRHIAYARMAACITDSSSEFHLTRKEASDCE
jgi:hypothetical protein